MYAVTKEINAAVLKLETFIRGVLLELAGAAAPEDALRVFAHDRRIEYLISEVVQEAIHHGYKTGEECAERKVREALGM